MKTMRDLIEAVTHHDLEYRKGFALSHNPDRDEVVTLVNSGSHVLRGVIDESGDLYLWDADHALHSDVDGIAGTHDYLSFILYPRHIDALQSDKRTLKAAMKANPVLSELGVWKMRMVSER